MLKEFQIDFLMESMEDHSKNLRVVTHGILGGISRSSPEENSGAISEGIIKTISEATHARFYTKVF